MDYITTYTGENFVPTDPDINQIHIEDIAHALSLMCRANGHFKKFYSIAQHSINCYNEAKARSHSEKVQMACLLHDASEAYLSDITRPVKKHLSKYQEIEKNLQRVIFYKFLSSPLTDDEATQVEKVDYDMLVYEFDALMRTKRIFNHTPTIISDPKTDFRDFSVVESDFIRIYKETSNAIY